MTPLAPTNAPIQIKYLGRRAYQTVWLQMQHYTDSRNEHSDDELWIVEHDPVFTQGQAGKAEHLLQPETVIPVIQSDRGGQITYHGPGQLVIYCLIDIKRRQLGVRPLVNAIEGAIIDLLNDFEISANTRADAPGVYVDGAKIASLGLRIRRGCSYHGLAFNIDMDLTPFNYINPCGMQNLPMTQLKSLLNGTVPEMNDLAASLTGYLIKRLETHSSKVAVPA